MRQLIAIAALLSSPAGGWAATACSFDQECFEAEPCEATDFALTYGAADRDRDITQIITDAETIEGQLYVPDDNIMILGYSGGAVHVLSTPALGGAARYTVHGTGGSYAVTYLGQCG